MRTLRLLLAALLTLITVNAASFAASVVNATTFSFPDVATLYNIGAAAPIYPNILIQNVVYSGTPYSEYAQWQTGGVGQACGTIDNVFWLRPPASPALTGCYKAVGFMPPSPSSSAPAGDQVSPLSYGANCHQADATFSGSISGTTLTVDSGTVVGTIRVGQLVWGSNAGPSLHTVITAGSGLIWTVNSSQTVPDNTLESVSAITAGDIAANPQWIGTYIVGDTWDTVGVNEAILAAFAGTSTPGHIVWNETLSNGPYSNKTYSQPIGLCELNEPILLVARGVNMNFAARDVSGWDWIGDPTKSMFTNDALSYGTIKNITLSSSYLFPVAAAPLWVMDWTGAYPVTLRTQQIEVDDMVLLPPAQGAGLSISPSGGGAQGDTIVLKNPLVVGGIGCTMGIGAGGSNALNINIIGGNIQGCQGDALQAVAGTFDVYGMSFQNQGGLNTGLFTPPITQATQNGADFHQYAGAGPSSISGMSDVRSESDIMMLSSSNNVAMRNDVSASASESNWYASYPFSVGQLVTGNGNGATAKYGHTFMVVDDGGNGVWNPMTTTSVPVTTITDSTASYTTNQWITNYSLAFRYSNGYTGHDTITANTATTVTTTTAFGPVTAPDLYHIEGHTGSSAPNWDGAPTGHSIITPIGTNQGFTTVAGNTTINTSSSVASQMAANNYLVLPNCDMFGPASGAAKFKWALITKIMSVSTSSFVVAKAPTCTETDGFGYWGATLSDGGEKYIDLDFNTIAYPASLDYGFSQSGKVEGAVPGSFKGYSNPRVTASKPSWLRNVSGTGQTLNADVRFFAYVTTDVTNFDGDNTYQQVPFNATLYNVGANSAVGIAACGYDTTTFTFTACMAGTLSGNYLLFFGNNNATTIFKESLYLDNTSQFYVNSGTIPTSGVSANVNFPYTFHMNAGDTLSLYSRNVNGSGKITTLEGSTTIGNPSAGSYWAGAFTPD